MSSRGGYIGDGRGGDGSARYSAGANLTDEDQAVADFEEKTSRYTPRGPPNRPTFSKPSRRNTQESPTTSSPALIARAAPGSLPLPITSNVNSAGTPSSGYIPPSDGVTQAGGLVGGIMPVAVAASYYEQQTPQFSEQGKISKPVSSRSWPTASQDPPGPSAIQGWTNMTQTSQTAQGPSYLPTQGQPQQTTVDQTPSPPKKSSKKGSRTPAITANVLTTAENRSYGNPSTSKR